METRYGVIILFMGAISVALALFLSIFLQRVYGAVIVPIKYLDTKECFQSYEHFLEVKKQNPELYQYVENVGLCDWGGYLVHVQIPNINNYEKDYRFDFNARTINNTSIVSQ